MARRRLQDPEPVLTLPAPTDQLSETFSAVIGSRPRLLPDVRYVRIETVEPDPEQPRQVFEADRLQELADSIRARGIEQPLVVQAVGPHCYRLIAGERRWRAARIAGLEEVPVLAYRSLSEEAVDEYQMNEFLLHEEPSVVEKARFIRAYKERNRVTWTALAAQLQVGESTLKAIAALDDAPPRVKELLEEGSLTPEHYRGMTAMPSPWMEPFAEWVAKKKIPAKKVKEAREAFLAGKVEESSAAAPDTNSAARSHLTSLAGETSPAGAAPDGSSESSESPDAEGQGLSHKETDQDSHEAGCSYQESLAGETSPTKTELSVDDSAALLEGTVLAGRLHDEAERAEELLGGPQEAKLTAKVSRAKHRLIRHRAADLGHSTVADYVRSLIDRDLAEHGYLPSR